MKTVFAVMLYRGHAWNPSLRLEDQLDWKAHAQFMEGLLAEEFVVLGGPLTGTSEVLLIFRATSEDEIKTRLAEDSWHRTGLLAIRQITPWELRLGALPSAAR